VPSESSGVSSSKGATSSTGGALTSEVTGSDEDGGCHDDEDCGELRCIDGSCYGCWTREDCAEGQRCWFDYCRALDEVPECVGLEPTVCGDSMIGALEECDAGGDCVDCSDGLAPETWIAAEQIGPLALLPSGDVLAVQRDDDTMSLVRHGARQIVWSFALDNATLDLAADADENAYSAGFHQIVGTAAAAPWIAAWDPSGELRWSIEETALGVYYSVATDGTRVLASGTTEQSNSPWPRGLLAQYDAEGALQWSAKHAEFLSVADVVLIGDEAAVIGEAISPWSSRTLMRIDDSGATLWSVDVSLVSGTDSGPEAVVHDGSGGTWVYGERDGGPWAVRHDASGEEIERLECLGRTAGRVTHLAVGPQGRLAVAVLVAQGPVAVQRHTPWIAFVDEGAISGASVIGPVEATLRLFDVGWRMDGSLAVGVLDHEPDGARVVIVQPGPE